ncbi:MAG: pilus assembly protein [Candidatus Dormibacteraeota bacterium]|nr:pilus assembly protein [Candidatus Dormibacteraeota bacterium]
MRSRRPRRGKLGQAIVETALLFPILGLLVMGSSDLGRVFYYSIEVTNAAREGARQGSSYDPANGNASATHAAVIAAVRSEAADLTLVEPSPAFSPVNCQSGPPYPDSYYPTAPNTGYVFACFAGNNGLEDDSRTAGVVGQTVRVTILYNFTPITPLIDNVTASGIHVQATATMVIQGPS